MKNQPNNPVGLQPDTQLSTLFNTQKLKRGVIMFVLITLVSLTVLFIYRSSEDTWTALRHLDIRFLLIALGLAILDMFIGGWRNHIFARVLRPMISPWVCFKANLANIFMGAVTPSQTGGGAAQLYMLHRSGIGLVEGMAISFINWVSTLVFFPLAACLSMVVIRDRFPDGMMAYLIQYSLVVYAVMAMVAVLALWRPAWLARVVLWLANGLQSLFPAFGSKVYKGAMHLVKSILRYQESCRKMLHQNPKLILYSFLITIALYINKFTVAYVLLLGLGEIENYPVVIAIQALITFVLYFAPSPGGSGIAEFSIAALMSGLIAGSILPVFTLLSRIFLMFFPAMVGALVMIRELKSHAVGFKGTTRTNPNLSVSPGTK